ncbi:hypothetical protein C1H46_018475 [Malus baccata]|uniref:Uncharacterized protein n=1 Tax=Malus baccata TaxID=106549 RepID=A0A540MAX7_MALBA|nr:hypothetical protein C1H46_018475 [Malus baccata]
MSILMCFEHNIVLRATILIEIYHYRRPQAEEEEEGSDEEPPKEFQSLEEIGIIFKSYI